MTLSLTTSFNSPELGAGYLCDIQSALKHNSLWLSRIYDSSQKLFPAYTRAHMHRNTHKLSGWSYVFPAAGGWTVINCSSFLSCSSRRTLPSLDCKSIHFFFYISIERIHFFCLLLLSAHTPSLFVFSLLCEPTVLFSDLTVSSKTILNAVWSFVEAEFAENVGFSCTGLLCSLITLLSH